MFFEFAFEGVGEHEVVLENPFGPFAIASPQAESGEFIN